MQPCHNYLVYGLNIRSNQPIPNLVPARSLERIDVNIELLRQQPKKVPFLEELDWRNYPKGSRQSGINIWQAQGDDGTYWRLEFLPRAQPLDFVINPDGSQVWGFYSDNHLYTTLASLLLSSVLGRVLLLRRMLGLHGSVISIDGRAIALIGASSVGKSTTAAALALRGCSVLADDVAALSQEGTKFWVQPGYPRLRLWRRSLEAFGRPVEALPKVTMYAEKRYLDLSINGDSQWQFQDKPLPLSAIYLLEKRDSSLVVPKIVPISQGEALGKLAANVFGKTMLDKQRISRNFQQLSHLVQAVPMLQLARPNDLARLSLIGDVIIDNFKGLIS